MDGFETYFSSLKGKKIAVLGLGVSNRPLVELLLEYGCDVTGCDRTPREKLDAQVLELENRGCKLRVGEGYLDGVEADILFRTPGMHPGNPAIQALRAGGAQVTSEMEVFFEVCPCQIIGVTGPVACGKSTLGKTFLCESPYEGSITFGGKELEKMEKADRNRMVGYLGHDPELFHGSVEDNIRLGGKEGAEEMIRVVCLEDEVKAMENGIHTLVGTGGVRLSGGQAQRLALARTLYHKRPVLILDDPFSALDQKTEAQIFANLKELAKDSIMILISHRLYLFDQMDQVIWMDERHTKVGTHEELLATVPSYAKLCSNQTKGGSF